PAALRDFCRRVGVARADSRVEAGLLDHCIREYLNRHAPRRMVVLDPLKMVITTYPEGRSETFETVNNPEDPQAGTRPVTFEREIWIERGDFMEDPPKKFFRLSPGREVRLRSAYLVTCEEVIRDEGGEVVEVRCSHDPESRGGDAPDGRRVKGTLHWVAASTAIGLEVRLYDHLFAAAVPGSEGD
ncbi:MAG: glutamine--tRNA ligase, partial [Planctomycetes bacterium]|nr:glutamine--tRNA ligase [Planctomycetota bacterium]